ncbi:solute carrier family 41 member 2 [Oryzias melastigma]|uniref:Solute carrier family 41 member n=1 Tax=Oryzias melastigma TaxID=30732 RepID=A0A3B3CVD9_ORYME|nr:solute carrier family 41 member 2 [Oryzias melastigma]
MVVPKPPNKKQSESGKDSSLSFMNLSDTIKHLNYDKSSSSTDAVILFEPGESDPLLSNRASTGKDAGRPAEPLCSMVLQILVPFLLAGLGTVSAGMLLDVVQSWDVFLDVTELFILIPAVLGMKGNLEMTLASRLSTAVNAGKMETSKEKWELILGNLALKQLQATLLGLLASFLAILLGWMAEGELSLKHVVLLCSTSVSTAFVASLLQGVIMVGVIIGCKRMNINPDNVATPMAASFGDLITLSLLACFSHWFYSFMDFYSYVLYLVNLSFICLIPVWVSVSSKHPASLILLRTGWEPIVTAMVISSMGGLILDKTVSNQNLSGVLLYAPVINGVGGNLVSIQSSRISTNLHLNFPPGELPEERRGCFNPCRIFFGPGANHQSARVLLLLVLPGQLLFLFTIYLMKGGLAVPSLLLTLFYLSAALLQVFLLLCLADCMVHRLWRRGKDPDSYAIPYLTALGDLLGTALTSLAVFLLWCIGDAGGL